MSAELIGILSVGVALAALLLTSIKGVREDVRRLESRLRWALPGALCLTTVYTQEISKD